MNILTLLNSIESEMDRIVLEKTELKNVSFEDLAKEMNMSINEVEHIHSRALSRLRALADKAKRGIDENSVILTSQYVMDALGVHKSKNEIKSLANSKGLIFSHSNAVRFVEDVIGSYGLKAAVINSTLEDIADFVDFGKQVIVSVDGGELIGDTSDEKLEDELIAEIPDHFVVFMLSDTEDNIVMVYDPAYGDIPLTISTETFIDAWKDSGNLAIVVEKVLN